MKFKEDQTTQKLRGGYYTPLNLANFVANWALQKQPKTILEPSCGDGVFLQALHNNKLTNNLKVSCFELFDIEAKKSIELASKLGLRNTSVTEGDFLAWANQQLLKKKSLFDAVIGNPPFIRYQFLETEFQEQAELVFKQLGLKFTKHTNAWVPFLLSSLALLKAGGRLAMIIPSEIIHVMHAQPLRSYMGEVCSKIVIIDPKEIWFEGTLQGAVIIFAEKKLQPSQPSEGIGIVGVEGFDFLNECPEQLFNRTLSINGETIEGKWTKAILNETELTLIKKITNHECVHQFKDIAKVDVGIVTGANKFFLVDNETVSTYKLEKYAYPMFGRSQHCPGIFYDKAQHEENQLKNLPTNFLHLKGEFNTLSSKVKNYIKLGETQNLHERYKCRIRKPWYTVPAVYGTEIGMLKRCHEAPRLILNQIGAYTTDTAYRITSAFTDAENLVCSFLNPITAISAELEGRYYGGGVLELVPSEIERLYIPIIDGYKHDSLKLNELVKNGKVIEAIRMQGGKILTELGFSSEDNEQLILIWQKLKDRRMRR